MASQESENRLFQGYDEYFKGVVLEGRKNSEGRETMPNYTSVFTQEAVWAIKSTSISAPVSDSVS